VLSGTFLPVFAEKVLLQRKTRSTTLCNASVADAAAAFLC